jgi:DNA-binding transcriptional MerR regulator
MTREAFLPPPRKGVVYHCAELARLLGRHANTLRQYEVWGFISAVPRQANGYRAYSARHALEALIAVTALRTSFNDWRGRRMMLDLIRAVAAGRYPEAESLLYQYENLLAEAEDKVRRAKEILEAWQSGERGGEQLIVGRWSAAELIGVAPDTLRDWERSGLVKPGRQENGRRTYDGPTLDRLLVIKVLREGGYSLMGIRHLLSGEGTMADLSHARDRWALTLNGLVADTRLLREALNHLSGID